MIMKIVICIIIFKIIAINILCGQNLKGDDKARQEINSLIDQYSEARDNKDTVLLKAILTPDMDQLVSSGEWRSGIKQSIEGMMRSSASNPGTRKLIVEKIRFLNSKTGLVDARYEIENPDGSPRKMWSTFIVVFREDKWKITSIRNMLPTDQN
jgi:uncharacterized protein (TIGR02246 family)